MTKLTITPIYGWGWTDRFDVPSPFVAEVENADQALNGTVTSGEYKGWRVALSKRHAGEFDGYCNLQLLSATSGKIFGYATIPNETVEL